LTVRRLLEAARVHGRGPHRGRLVQDRRPGRGRRRWLPLDHGPLQGPHHPRRREHLGLRGRERALHAPEGGRGGAGGHARSAAGRARVCVRDPQARGRAHAGRAGRISGGAQAGAPQVPRAARAGERVPDDAQREGPEVQTARGDRRQAPLGVGALVRMNGPRVWPVFLAYLLAFASIVSFSLAAAVLLRAAFPELTEREVFDGLPGILASAMASAAALVVTLLVVARPIDAARLRLLPGRETGLQLGAMILGTLALGQALDSITVL